MATSDRNATALIELTGKVMAVATVLLFFIVFFVFCIHLYAKCFWYRRPDTPTPTPAVVTRRRRPDITPAPNEPAAVSIGLDPSTLKNIPTLTFDPKHFKDGLECAVCLSEVSNGEKIRFLPKCRHGFHVDCIDMWFESHSTCPLCRNAIDSPKPAKTEPVETGENSGPAEAPNFPTNVLIWGNEMQVSTISEPSSSNSNSTSAIDIPGHVIDDEEQKSIPVAARIRSLKRLLSGNRRINPTSPREQLDIEQGSR